MHVGDNIRSLRKREGYSQADLASCLGVSKETVCRWETGKTLPRQRYIAALAARFSLTRDDLTSIDAGLAAQELLHNAREGLPILLTRKRRTPCTALATPAMVSA